ncbi:four-carbon acid sugar kinase family protein [Rhizobium paknamense]|uniref:Uncharacterized protein YgbK (DUF1537 family) n=1 Tax=Rhizobium paknamense TaxID=1206817 RepID=A0ABU0IBK5_9HYPH|nr:four-carbon acid sugar kinase family protein [Rhizobium paknamense]MDQ0455609.1 uncharacterized protein YgbK (DUF1537 family) [Rhizobium paknamense]
MLAILADDLTGAIDAAAPFAGRGLTTDVLPSPEGLEAALQAAGSVISINLGCRDGTPEEARQLTAQVLSRLPPDITLFKKIDSRLKGHIAAELDAIPFRRALVQPAIPDFGRIVRNGCLQGFGVETPIPVADRLGVHAGKCRIEDAASEAEMDRALATVQAEGADLLIGARGLAEALARSMTARPAKLVPVPEGAGVFIIGSRDPITLAQIECLEAAGTIVSIAAPNGEVPATTHADAPVVLVQAIPGKGDVPPHLVSERLAAGTVPMLTEKARTLLLSGGATAEAVMRTMGVTRLRLMGECLPGLGLGWAGDHCIIAKSGGFGQVDTLWRIARQMLGDEQAGQQTC